MMKEALVSMMQAFGTVTVLATAAAWAAPAPSLASESWLLYFGTYTAPGKSLGIYVASFDGASGKVGSPRLVAETESPSFLAVHPTRPLMYAVNELDNFDGQSAGSVSTFAMDAATGGLRLLGRVSSRGAHPCHVVVDRTGKYVLVANYTGGSVASFALRPDGSLEAAPTGFVQHAGASVDAKRQTAPHAHMIATDPSNSHALVADLGLDQVLVYGFDSGRLTPSTPVPDEPRRPSGAEGHARLAPGSGPRHFSFSPDGRDIYVLNEMLLTITAFRYETGRLLSFQTASALPASMKPGPADSGAEIQVHPNGRFVYASLRGHDSLAVFARDASTGRLELVEHVPSGGRTPRSFVIDPTGRHLLAGNQNSDKVVVFRIDPGSGRLTPTGEAVGVSAPVSMAWLRLNSARN